MALAAATLIVAGCGASHDTVVAETLTSKSQELSSCTTTRGPSDPSAGRSYGIREIARAFERQGFRVHGGIEALVEKHFGIPALLSLDNARLRPPHWQGETVLSVTVFPTATDAAAMTKCLGRMAPGEYLRKGNVQIWKRLAPSPQVLAAARRALASLPD